MAVLTKAQLTTLITTNFPDNTTGLITPAALRAVVQDMVDSYLDAQGVATAAANTALMGPNTGVATVPTFRRPDATDATFTQAGTGAVQRGLSSKIQEYPITPEDYGAIGNGIADDTAAIQEAINQAQITGRIVQLTNIYGISRNGANAYCLLITSAVNIQGVGNSGPFPLGWLKPLAGLANTVDLILVQGSSTGALDGLTIQGISIGNNTAPLGRDAIFIDTTGGNKDFGGANIIHNKIFPVNGMSIRHTNDAATANGGWFSSIVENNEFFNGFTTFKSGSAIVIRANTFHGGGAGQPWIQSSVIVGGLGPQILENLFETEGFILIDGGDNTIITDNRIELDSGPGSNGAMINLRGNDVSVNGTIINSNAIINISANALAIYHIRVTASAPSTVIGFNNWYTTNATQIATGSWINNAATTMFFYNDQFYQPATIPIGKGITNTGGVVSTAQFGRTDLNDPAAYPVTVNDYYLAFRNVSVARTVNLPAATAFTQGRYLRIVDSDGSATAVKTISVLPAGADTINGAGGAAVIINFARGEAVLTSDGVSNWTVPFLSLTGDVTGTIAAGKSISTTVTGVAGATGSATFLSGTAIPAGGTAGSGYKFSSTANFGVFFGSNAPSLAAAKGSLYLRSNGSGINDRAYINTDGGTTWTALVTVA